MPKPARSTRLSQGNSPTARKNAPKKPKRLGLEGRVYKAGYGNSADRYKKVKKGDVLTGRELDEIAEGQAFDSLPKAVQKLRKKATHRRGKKRLSVKK